MELKLENIWFRYEKKKWLLRNVVAIFEPGINCILGKNGSGKTTLIRIIIGSIKPSKGRIMFNNKRIKSIDDASRYMIYVPSDARNFFVEPTVRDEIESEGIKPNDFWLKDIIDKQIIDLSEGQRRMLALLIALHSKKDVVVLDEPTVGLDKEKMNLFWTVASGISQRKIIIIATNETKLMSYCDRIFILKNGQLEYAKNPIEALEKLPYKTMLGLLIRKLKDKGIEVDSMNKLGDAVSEYIC